MNDLAITLGKEGKLQEAEKLLREASEIATSKYGSSARVTWLTTSNLADTLAYEKRADESIALFEKLLQYSSNTEGSQLRDTHYEYAAALAVLGRKDQAFQQLNEAVKAGFGDADQLTSDDDMKPLRSDPRFAALVAEIKKKHAVAAK
jgi:tetratricopeptide (TPR) repeat protein